MKNNTVETFKELHRLDGDCNECGGTGEGNDNPNSDRGETYPCYMCNGTGTWSVYRQKDVDKFLTLLTQHHQDELREVYREILELTYEKDDMNEQVPNSLKNYGQAMGEMHQAIKALAQTRRIDISDKK